MTSTAGGRNPITALLRQLRARLEGKEARRTRTRNDIGRDTDEILKGQRILMADISTLQAAVDKLGADATADHDAIIAAFTEAKTSIDALTAQIAALSAGTIDQATIDALSTSVDAADTAINDAATAVVPVVTPTP